MNGDGIKELLARRPFQPFRIRKISGESYEIHNPGLVVPLKSYVFIAFPDGFRWTFCPYLQISSIDALQAA